MRFSATTMRDIDAALPAGYSARFVRAEDTTVDDSIDILLHGTQTRWAIQLGDTGYVGVNEYGFDANGEIEWMQDHGTFRTVAAAVAHLRGILAKE